MTHPPDRYWSLKRENVDSVTDLINLAVVARGEGCSSSCSGSGDAGERASATAMEAADTQCGDTSTDHREGASASGGASGSSSFSAIESESSGVCSTLSTSVSNNTGADPVLIM